MNNNNTLPNQINENNYQDASRNKDRILGSLALTKQGDSQQDRSDESLRKVNSFINRNGRLLNVFSRDASLKFVPSKNAETFSFDASNYSINVPTKWFENDDYTENELLFANYHERAHFIDMRKNPKAYIDNYSQMEQDAAKLSISYCKKHPGSDFESLKGCYYKELHTLYNCLDDIYVNKLVEQRVPFFQTKDGSNATVAIYEKSGFANADFRGQPPHTQFVFSLLRDAMLSKEKGKSIVDDDVEKELNSKIIGRDIRQTVHEKLEPTNGILVDPSDRYKLIRSGIQPIFIRLLEEYLDDNNGSLPKSNQDNSQTNGEQEPADNSQTNGEQESAGNTDSIDSDNNSTRDTENSDSAAEKYQRSIFGEGANDDIKKQVLEKFAEDDEVEKMSNEERIQYEKNKAIKKFDDKHGITEDERRIDTETKKKIEKPRNEMRSFWRRLVGKSVRYHRELVSGQRKGRINIDSVIDNYANMENASRQGEMRGLEIYDRYEMKREVVDQPEEIEITLLVDCSGSMSGEREEYARQAAALLMYSVKDFNDEIEASRRETHSNLRAFTQVIKFGSIYNEVKKFDKKKSILDMDADIIKSLAKIDSNSGSTDDATPLEAINNSITLDEINRIKNKKLKKIIFEITDGVSDDSAKTSQSINALAEKGITMVGFQIGNMSESERALFNDSWKNGNGIYLGEDVSSLPKELIEKLADSLNDIII